MGTDRGLGAAAGIGTTGTAPVAAAAAEGQVGRRVFVEVADDLLAGQKRVVADVVDGDDRTDRHPPAAHESQFPGRAPRLGPDSLGGDAEQGLFRRIQEPRVGSIKRHAQVLHVTGIDGPADGLRGVVMNGDLDRFPAGAPDGFQEARFVHGKQVALGPSRSAGPVGQGCRLRGSWPGSDGVRYCRAARRPRPCPHPLLARGSWQTPGR